MYSFRSFYGGGNVYHDNYYGKATWRKLALGGCKGERMRTKTWPQRWGTQRSLLHENYCTFRQVRKPKGPFSHYKPVGHEIFLHNQGEFPINYNISCFPHTFFCLWVNASNRKYKGLLKLKNMTLFPLTWVNTSWLEIKPITKERIKRMNVWILT